MITAIVVGLIFVNVFLVGAVCYLWGHQQYISETVVGEVADLESDVSNTIQDFRESIHSSLKEVSESTKSVSLMVDRIDDLEQSVQLIKGRMK